MFTVYIICNNIFIPVVWKAFKTEVPVLIYGQKKRKLYCPWGITPVMKMTVIAAALWSHVTCVACIETGCWLCIKCKTKLKMKLLHLWACCEQKRKPWKYCPWPAMRHFSLVNPFRHASHCRKSSDNFQNCVVTGLSTPHVFKYWELIGYWW